MGRMKELLDQRLEENKYEMWEVLKEIMNTDPYDVGIEGEPWEKARRLLNKIGEVEEL